MKILEAMQLAEPQFSTGEEKAVLHKITGYLSDPTD